MQSKYQTADKAIKRRQKRIDQLYGKNQLHPAETSDKWCETKLINSILKDQSSIEGEIDGILTGGYSTDNDRKFSALESTRQDNMEELEELCKPRKYKWQGVRAETALSGYQYRGPF